MLALVLGGLSVGIAYLTDGQRVLLPFCPDNARPRIVYLARTPEGEAALQSGVWPLASGGTVVLRASDTQAGPPDVPGRCLTFLDAEPSHASPARGWDGILGATDPGEGRDMLLWPAPATPYEPSELLAFLATQSQEDGRPVLFRLPPGPYAKKDLRNKIEDQFQGARRRDILREIIPVVRIADYSDLRQMSDDFVYFKDNHGGVALDLEEGPSDMNAEAAEFLRWKYFVPPVIAHRDQLVRHAWTILASCCALVALVRLGAAWRRR